MKTLSLKLPDRLHVLLHAAVQERQRAKSDLVREALDAYLTNTTGNKAGSFAALTVDLAGKIKGPHDFAANPRHLSGFGQ